jgi:predicted ATPase
MKSPDNPSRRFPFISGVVIGDYKSLGVETAVIFSPLTVLVGKNGSGKSNFIDALRFLADSLETSLDHAVRSRGVPYGISRRGVEPPRFNIYVGIQVSARKKAGYILVVEMSSGGEFSVSVEILTVTVGSKAVHKFKVTKGKVIESSIKQPPVAQRDRLYLVAASSLPEFRPVYDALSRMKFYDFNAEAMRKPQNPDIGGWLRSDGSNVASVVARLSVEQPEALRRITQYLSAIVPGIISIERVSLGPVETLKFTQGKGASEKPAEFFAWSMSEGTLRALGSLVAVNQFAGRSEKASLVGIEEPETSLHPAAAAVLMDGLREATTHTQVVITTHSPDLLDQMDLATDTLLAVAMQDGVTRIAPIDEASLSAIRAHLYTPGELLRMDQLEPDQVNLTQQKSSTKGNEEV